MEAAKASSFQHPSKVEEQPKTVLETEAENSTMQAEELQYPDLVVLEGGRRMDKNQHSTSLMME